MFGILSSIGIKCIMREVSLPQTKSEVRPPRRDTGCFVCVARRDDEQSLLGVKGTVCAGKYE